MKKFSLITIILVITSCASWSDVISKAGAFAGHFGTILDQVEYSSERYFSRNPNPESEALIDQRIRDIRSLLSLFYQILQKENDINDQKENNINDQKEELKLSYRQLLIDLNDSGVTSAEIRGGAETDAIIPLPLILPSEDELFED